MFSFSSSPTTAQDSLKTFNNKRLQKYQELGWAHKVREQSERDRVIGRWSYDPKSTVPAQDLHGSTYIYATKSSFASKLTVPLPYDL
ncbi:hypothetical protein WG66_005282 [Moniliophthora roreri]|nr:hypothetical protein WG66_005282 [Moniliophthora roreri]